MAKQATLTTSDNPDDQSNQGDDATQENEKNIEDNDKAIADYINDGVDPKLKELKPQDPLPKKDEPCLPWPKGNGVKHADGVFRPTEKLVPVCVKSHGIEKHTRLKPEPGQAKHFIRVTINHYSHEVSCDRQEDVPIEIAQIIGKMSGI